MSIIRLSAVVSCLLTPGASALVSMSSFKIWQYYNDGFWSSYDELTCLQIEDAKADDADSVLLTEGQYRQGTNRWSLYLVLIDLMVQKNLDTGACRSLRVVEAVPSGFDPVPTFATSSEDDITRVFEPVGLEHLPCDEVCNICLSAFNEDPSNLVVRLQRCQGHWFHMECIDEWLREKRQCPYCKIIYGVITGNCPRGEMYLRHLTRKLPGYTGLLSEGTWMITWDIASGVQDASHPNPGVDFTGTVRVGYIPDTDPFREVLRMFQLAWKRRLMFTVGTSLTSGLSNVVIWNGIHVRTEWQDRTGFGWPAPLYLGHVTEELKAKGITPDQIE